MLTLTPGSTALATLEAVYRGQGAVRLDPACRAAVDAASARVAEAAAGARAVYGINTGFGKLATIRIPPEETATLQRNLILSHCAGVGEPLDRATTRLMLALKLLSLGRGASGVRWEVIAALEACLAYDILPVVPVQGSVGASGDLAPLAHMTAALMGAGEVFARGMRRPAAEALAAAGITPLVLGPKEGLALINGTQFSTALALAALFSTQRLFRAALVTACLATDAAMGSTDPLQPEIHALRGHPGQSETAAEMRRLMAGSEIRESHREGDPRVQDPYCIRCAPQVMGAALDLIRFAARMLEIEANAVTDNPLVTAAGILSGGNFHAEPVAFAADILALALAELGAIAQRRIALLVDPALNFDLPPFLAVNPGLESGFMVAEITSAALMSENKHLAHPCATDSTPTSANQEDHVSMAAHAARRLLRMTENLAHILAIEALVAAQGIACRAPLTTAPALAKAIAVLRSRVPPLTADRILAPDIAAAAALVLSDALAHAAGVELVP